jgi:hypothetical protein
MQWFFDQWVYGTEIPKITVEYGVKDSADGPVLEIDVKQEKVRDGFAPCCLCWCGSRKAG